MNIKFKIFNYNFEMTKGLSKKDIDTTIKNILHSEDPIKKVTAIKYYREKILEKSGKLPCLREAKDYVEKCI